MMSHISGGRWESGVGAWSGTFVLPLLFNREVVGFVRGSLMVDR